jgi:hypothetical protein
MLVVLLDKGLVASLDTWLLVDELTAVDVEGSGEVLIVEGMKATLLLLGVVMVLLLMDKAVVGCGSVVVLFDTGAAVDMRASCRTSIATSHVQHLGSLGISLCGFRDFGF